MNFTRQTAVVVGASRGLGRGVVESLLAKEMIVTAVARNPEDLEDLDVTRRRKSSLPMPLTSKWPSESCLKRSRLCSF